MEIGFLFFVILRIFAFITVSVKSSKPEASTIRSATVVARTTGSVVLIPPSVSTANTHAVNGIREVAPKKAAMPSTTIRIYRSSPIQPKAIIALAHRAPMIAPTARVGRKTPPVAPDPRGRLFSLEFAAETPDGKKLAKYVLATGYNHSERHEKASSRQWCYFFEDELGAGDIRFTVTPVNCFGSRGRPITAAYARAGA